MTYNDEGDIANIYNNQVVITKNPNSLDVTVEGMDKIHEDNQELYMRLIEIKGTSGGYKLQNNYLI